MPGKSRTGWTRWFLWKAAVLAVLIISLAMPGRAGAYQVTSKNISEEIITQGAILQTVRLNTDEGPINIYIIKANLGESYLKVDTIIGADGTLNKTQAVTEMAKRVGAVAAINGDFFQMDVGKTIGLAYQGGNLVESPALREDMYGFGLASDKLPIIDVFGFSGQVTAGNGKSFPLAGINKPDYLTASEISSDVEALTLYNPIWGAKSRGRLTKLSGTVEAVVKGGIVQQIFDNQPGVPIPQDGYVLKGHGQAAKFINENLPAGSKVSYTYAVTPQGDKLFAAVGGQALLVENGHLPAYFTQNIAGKYARTAAGVSSDGKTLFLVTVERQVASDGSLLSRGMSQEELAAFLISTGVWRAVNLDGGGSTTLAARHLGDSEASLVNRPQGTSQRRVPDAIGLFSTAPQGALNGMVLNGPPVLLTGTKGAFTAKGYDQYYNPLQIESNKITWSVPVSAGVFTSNVFAPKQSGSVTVRAALGSASGTAEVRVIGPESLSALVVSPSFVIVEPGQTAQLKAQVKTTDGEVFDLRPQDVNWTVDSTVGHIENGKFTAVDKTATGEIKVAFQGLSMSVPVSIKPPWVELQVDPGRVCETSLDGWIKAQFPAKSLSSPMKIVLAYTGAPSDLPEGCSSLGAVTIGLAQGQVAGIAAPWRVSFKYKTEVVSSRPAVMYWDSVTSKWKEQPSLVEGDGLVKTITAKVWGFGKLVLVDDSRQTPSFKDIGGHWAKQAITSLSTSRVVNGFPDGSYMPDYKVTRAQFVTMLAAALQWPVPESAPTFKDTVPEWARQSVAAAVSRGVVSGYPEGTFAPDAGITRSEMAVMISRALALAGTKEGLAYSDAKSVPDFAVDAVAGVSAAGLLQGSGGYFRPLDGATRAETAVAINRLLSLWVK